MLCEDEPFPPSTIQHKATYQAIIRMLFMNIELEEDCMDDLVSSEELLDFIEQEKEDWKNRNSDRATARGSTSMNNAMKHTLINYQGERNKKKFEKGRNEKMNEPFQVPDKEQECDDLQKGIGSIKMLFEGGPAKRANLRVPTDEEERSAFDWRIQCDAALQEDVSSPFPLSRVNFDWRCSIMSKWYQALNLLLYTRKISTESPTENALILFELNSRAYANPENFPRISAIQKHIKILRQTFESSFDPSNISSAQRCIYAVCSDGIFCNEGHEAFEKAFIRKCAESGINFSKVGNFQKRFDIFRAMKDDYVEGLDKPFSDFCYNPESALRNPSKYKAEIDVDLKPHCFGPGDGRFSMLNKSICFNTENLKACSRCKVATYCSAECQRKDWKSHKKVCATLAAERKNRRKIAEMSASIKK
uniref:MYND-type domain-containing protein n=1 Tax=Asterionellopsis glacialis TaxID=33640 RepID=A0A7S0KXG1_9STRA|mmetsp:Transcript_202/g.270  ORF Transcript_202/g.270 Transcript_202/m.270 type:complete len:419 (+) Transcript_202:3-1259(+)